MAPAPASGEPSASPPRPVPLALWLHRGLAAAVEQRQPEAAETFSRAILAEIGTDPLPLDDGIALEHALAPTVDPPPPGESTRVRSFSPVSPAP